MKADQNKYPVFEANQVLTNAHLNQVFDYLDEQDRLTRANLIGIGIVCGLEATYDNTVPNIKISLGCGIPSEGYLILMPEEVTLVSYKPYILPEDIAYEPFTFQTGNPPHAEQYELFEMFEVGEPNATVFTTSFLANKVILLFLELKKDGLRNCSPNNCDDRGEEVTITLRKLLIERSKMDEIIIAANNLPSGLSAADIAALFTAKMNLPDIRLPRYNVPSSSLSSSVEVYNSFIQVIKKDLLVTSMKTALSASYTAFKPLLEKDYPSDPFTGFTTAFGFLESFPANTTQVKFLQYYHDFFDDLIKAYDEFRWSGIELTCICCPPEGLFPRHLMVREVVPSVNAVLYRHTFMQSPASCCDCEKERNALIVFFRRLVEITTKFTNTPPLPAASTALPDPQIRITPSKLWDVLNSEKCIPYYYTQNGTPPLYEVWNAEKTRRGKAKQNLSYRADEYATANFVLQPLQYDIEPNNFLRIEGHLGKNYLTALQSLITLKKTNRLPIEIIALRTGAFDENMTVDLSKEECRFQDLETLYDTLREELLHELCEGVLSFYEVQDEKITGAAGTPKMDLVKKYAPNYLIKANSVGAWYESQLTKYQAMAYLDVDQNQIDSSDVLMVYCVLFFGASGLPGEYYPHVVAIYYLSKLSEILPDSFDQLGFADFKNKYEDLIALVRYLRSDAAKNISSNLTAFQPQEELIDHFDSVLFSGKYEPIAALHEEYLRRIKEVKQKQFLSYFLINNPGIQHKAGVPIGGTFILVYHQDPSPKKGGKDFVVGNITTEGVVMTAMSSAEGTISKRMASNPIEYRSAEYSQVGEVLEKLIGKPEFYYDPDFQYLYGKYTGGFIPSLEDSAPPAGLSDLQKIIRNAVNELADGTVIADFYLPYICCSDCAPIQYVLPKTPPVFTTSIGCTNANNISEVTVTPEGGVAPYSIKVDNGDFTALGTNSLLLSPGNHTLTIKDAEGTESDPKTITVPNPITLGAETITDNPTNGTWQATIPISGGTSPYVVITGGGTINGSTFTSNAVASGTTLKVEIADSTGCNVTKEITHEVPAPCTLPCNGIARKCGYRFWLPIPSANAFYTAYRPVVKDFHFTGPSLATIDIRSKVEDIIRIDPNNVPILNTAFKPTIDGWIKAINHLIEGATGGNPNWLILSYEQKAGDSFGTLWIEYFECLEFRFEMIMVYKMPENLQELTTIYDPSGTSIRLIMDQGVQEAKIPVFNCIQTNKCDPSQPILKLFKEPDTNLEISKTATDNNVTMEAKISGSDKPVRFFWEFEGGTPMISNEKSPIVSYKNSTQKTNTIRLTAFTKSGGRVVLQDKVTVSSTTPGGIMAPTGMKKVSAVKKSTIVKPAGTVKPKKATPVKKATRVKKATPVKKASKSLTSTKTVKKGKSSKK